MGSGASINDDQVDQETFKALAGEHYSEEVFNSFKNEHGLISKAKILELQDMIQSTNQIKEAFNTKCKQLTI